MEDSKPSCGQPPGIALGVKIPDLHFGLFLCAIEEWNVKRFFQKAYFEVRKFSLMYKELEVSAHAAAASFYLFLSIIPLIGLFLTIIPYSPITQEQLVKFLSLILPASLDAFIDAVTLQMYGQGPLFLILSAVVLVWSAGKGMQSITRGLNAVNGVKNEKRSFFVLRAEACLYTTILVVLMILSVAITFIGRYVLTRMMEVTGANLKVYIGLLENRYLFEWILLAAFFSVLYGWVPYHKNWPHRMWRGGLFAGVTCTLFSWAFSFYLEHFHGFSMYGSMATIMITMFWIFGFMTLFFAGALLNVYFWEFNEKRRNKKVKGQNIFEKEVVIRDIDKYGVVNAKRRHRRKSKKEKNIEE